jgi:four helix bundle protein
MHLGKLSINFFFGESMLESDVAEKSKVGYFDFEKWDVYRAALEFIIVVKDVVEGMPRGSGYLIDQLQRAATSVPLNIAEGAGEHALDEKARFYRMAKRSATECASILGVCRQLQLINENQHERGRELLLRIAAMLTKMSRISGR